MGVVSVNIPISELNNWFIILERMQRVEVAYDKDQLKMANKAIEKIKDEALTVLNGVNMHNDFTNKTKEEN